MESKSYLESFEGVRIKCDYIMKDKIYCYDMFEFDYYFPDFRIGVLLNVYEMDDRVIEIVNKKYNIHVITFEEGTSVDEMVNATKDLMAYVSFIAFNKVTSCVERKLNRQKPYKRLIKVLRFLGIRKF